MRASWKPFGIGEQRPNNFKEVGRAFWENRDSLPYAWRILNEGVCDGCALGTKGMKDWTLDGVHLCNIRLRLLRLNTMGALDTELLKDAEALRAMKSRELRDLGRLPHPMRRRRGDKGFTRIAWDEALDTIAERIRAAGADKAGFYLTSRGMSNESYYAAGKAVRAIGTNSIDNAARMCHSPSTYGLKEALGVGASTCSFQDWIDSDLIVFIGSNVANNQPVATKYLHHAKKNGARVAVLNTYREPGMERYWIPSVPSSALFGTKIADEFFLIDTGGDAAFLNGALKHLAEIGAIDEPFIAERTTGWGEVESAVAKLDWGELERAAGVPRERMEDFARMMAAADRAVLVWSMGVTQHAHGEDNVRAIVNLALARGIVGREGCGLMPIRGHSGVQGGAEMGCYTTSFPGGDPVNEENAAKLSGHWGFDVSAQAGLTAPEMLEADLEVLFSSGGNYLEVMPDPEKVEAALDRVPLRVHMDIVLSGQMFVPGEEVLLLPASTRYECEGGVTETTTERRVVLSPEIEGQRIGEARAEWDVFLDLARRVRPELAEQLTYARGTPQLREEIERVVPRYQGIAALEEGGDSFQYGGRLLCETGEVKFLPVSAPERIEREPGRFLVSTRRGKQFNSMVQEERDALTGAGRETVLVSEEDAERLGIENGGEVIVRSDHGELRGRALLAPVTPGNLQVHWPEGNVLFDSERRSEEAGIPDYNAAAWLEAAEPPVKADGRRPRRSNAGLDAPRS
ncbi:MAG: FdhF/YdeP family oxidoreductase [Thermoleophilaceae bacterium]|nr:FdhF/YdeP family oxidoreductase [Thermoleophilaceae bacterium]